MKIMKVEGMINTSALPAGAQGNILIGTDTGGAQYIDTGGIGWSVPADMLFEIKLLQAQAAVPKVSLSAQDLIDLKKDYTIDEILRLKEAGII